MANTAVVRLEGVGGVKSAANTLPTTWVDVANVPEGALMRENPVMEEAAAGLMPMFPAIDRKKSIFYSLIAEPGMVDIPLLASTIKFPEVPKFMAGGPNAKTTLVTA
ncbi:hypothetical protein M422DRAFT_268625 [Sphaerobolus stellatus SS14]|uniref:Uncharacterized protein n=1 Tax=Sphaerobolus stellatus (strain SS14) TaxID=990650 RepID=A0A0C9TJP6_SPHS4|nr:hypothetical protein M422DRAFT_268625 [Sphaerobolus stellatus SS14]